MSGNPSLVVGYDLLLSHSDIVPLGGRTPYDDLSLSATAAPSPPVTLRFGDCALEFPQASINALIALRDAPNASSVTIHRANAALERLAKARESGENVTMPRLMPGDSHREHADFIELVRPIFQGQHDKFLLVARPELRLAASIAEIPVIPAFLPGYRTVSGIRYLLAPDSLMQELETCGQLSENRFHETYPEETALHPNEYLVFYPAEYQVDDRPRRLDPTSDIVTGTHMGASDYHRSIVRYHADEHRLKRLQYLDPHDTSIPRDTPALAAYYDALRDPDIDSIIVCGPAGSGKTFAAVSCARESCISGQHIQIITMNDGKSVLGAVRGGVEEKMAPMNQLYYDALRSAVLQTHEMQKKLFEQAKYGLPENDPPPPPPPKKLRKSDRKKAAEGIDAAEEAENTAPRSVGDMVEDIVRSQWAKNFVSVPYQYAMGRSFDHSFVLLDEAQRLEPDLLDTLLSRAGNGSKLVVMGDFAQSSRAPALTGLAYASRLFEGAPHTAHIELTTVLRGPTAATVAANRLRVRRELGLSF